MAGVVDMLKYFMCPILIVSAPVLAENCLEMQDSADGVPAVYYQEKCLAEDAFEKGSYAEAAEHYEKASVVKFFEAPNYELRLEWAESLCLSGKHEEGRKLLESFVLMARADLGEIECPENVMEVLGSEHMELACIGYGSSLSYKGRVDLKQRLERADEVVALCKDV